MRICIVGTGAIGGWIGTRVAASGAAEVSAVARGATLDALREHGWRLHHAVAATRTGAGSGDRSRAR